MIQKLQSDYPDAEAFAEDLQDVGMAEKKSLAYAKSVFGMRNVEIADDLDISEPAVSNYISSAEDELVSAKSLAELALQPDYIGEDIDSMESQNEYYHVVEAIAEEFSAGIAEGAARDIAAGAIASCQVIENKPVIGLATGVWGENIESLDRAFFPSEVLLYTESEVTGDMGIQDSERAALAIEALISDLEQAHAGDLSDGEVVEV